MRKGRVCALLMAFFFVLSVTHVCFAQDLESIHQAIQSRGARWIAGDTSIARLSLGERSMRARLIKPHHTGQEKLLTAHLEQSLFGARKPRLAEYQWPELRDAHQGPGVLR